MPIPVFGNGEFDPRLPVLARAGHAQANRTRLGELAGVAQQVQQDLAQPHVVGVNRADLVGTVQLERVLVLLGERPRRAEHLVDDRPDRHALEGEIHLARLDLREIEDVVD
jgi:hypothetical protein